MSGYFKRRSMGDNLFEIINAAFLGICALITIFPLWNVLMTSLVGVKEFNERPIILWPRDFNLDSYKYLLFYSKDITAALKTTITVTVLGSLYSLFLTTCLAYGLSKKYLPGRNVFLTFIMVTMFFNGGLIPYYLLIRNLHLMDTFPALFVSAGVNTFYFVVIKSFFTQFPSELEESARVDGANDFKIFFRIVLPLSMPVLATFFLFYAVYYWNSWYSALLFIQKNIKLKTLQLVLRQMIVQSDRSSTNTTMNNLAREAGANLFEHGLRMATVMIATIPIICVYPFLQKYFVKGVMIGSVKG